MSEDSLRQNARAGYVSTYPQAGPISSLLVRSYQAFLCTSFLSRESYKTTTLIMPGRLLQWPEWPEFTFENAEKNEDLLQYKNEIIAQYGEDALRKSWLKVCGELAKITDDLAEKGTSAIPEIPFEDLLNLSDEQKQRCKDTGCFVVRDVIPDEQTTKLFWDLKKYVADNRDQISGWPVDNPILSNLYFSPTQISLRSHPNQLATARALNSWWHDSTGTSSPDPLSYADAVRIRPPKKPLAALGPHIDAGSLSRWADPTYRCCYDAVWSGHPEDLDLYDLTKRQYAKQAAFFGSAHSRVLRAFQGWTALTSAGPGEGSLMLYPSIKYATAYVLLRPFFSPPTGDGDIMDYKSWAFDATTPWFPGTWRDRSQYLSPTSHPHLRLRECMISIPRMNPGDCIFWHCDMVHAVEVEHNGEHDACVAYIAATMSTEVNKDYIRKQLADFKEGRAPEDFRSERKRVGFEPGFVGWMGEKAILSVEGRRAMGFDA
jgi:hypothetical protein